MLHIARVLAPIDFSEPSRAAAYYAGRLAKRMGARLSLMHMVAPISFEYSMVPASAEVLSQLSESRLLHARAALDAIELGDVVVERELAEGDPATEILRRAAADHSDLIVMSTRGTGAMKRVLAMGSVTMNVLARAECPVLTGRDFSVAPVSEGSSILCALDLSSNAERVLRWAHDAARTFGAHLTVVHAATMADKAVLELASSGWYDDLRQRIDDHLRGVLDGAGIEAEVIVGDGSPHAVVSQTARKLGSGLVVIGRSPANDVIDRLRAHSYDIIRRAPCPVVSV
jgi:nucleotide-binding universal stress UspA family protein